MSSLFKSPSVQAPTPQPVPTIDTAAQQQDVSDRMRRRRGAASTILVGDPLGGAAPQASAAKLILGQ